MVSAWECPDRPCTTSLSWNRRSQTAPHALAFADPLGKDVAADARGRAAGHASACAAAAAAAALGAAARGAAAAPGATDAAESASRSGRHERLHGPASGSPRSGWNEGFNGPDLESPRSGWHERFHGPDFDSHWPGTRSWSAPRFWPAASDTAGWNCAKNFWIWFGLRSHKFNRRQKLHRLCRRQ